MLKNISGSNYKAFESFDISISPITVLLGSNSSGKSSIINLLLMLSQTFDSDKELDSPLRLNGKKVDLGEAINIQHNRNAKLPLELCLNFDKTRQIGYLDQLISRTVFSMIEILVYHRPASFLTEQCNISYDSELFTVLTTLRPSHRINRKSLKIIRDNIETINKALIKFTETLDLYGDADNERYSKKSIENYISFNENILFLESSDISIREVKYEILNETINESSNKDEIKHFISKATLKNRNSKNVLEIDFKSMEIKSDLISSDYLDKDLKNIFKVLSSTTLNLLDIEEDYLRYMPARMETTKANSIVSLILRLFNQTVNESFNDNEILHVTPLRAQPKRYYLLENSIDHKHLNTSDGTSLAEILKKNPKIVIKLNALLEDFDMKIKVDKTNEIIHQIRVIQNGLELDITDVGFGISQVLPILVQALKDDDKSIIIIEQPEIHLHPKMQTWLTDCLLKIALDDGKKFIIETHSELIIKRIQLRMLDDNFNVTRNHVNILNFERQTNSLHTSTVIKSVPVNELCEIEWPKGFFEDKLSDAIKIRKLRLALLEGGENELESSPENSSEV